MSGGISTTFNLHKLKTPGGRRSARTAQNKARTTRLRNTSSLQQGAAFGLAPQVIVVLLTRASYEILRAPSEIGGLSV